VRIGDDADPESHRATPWLVRLRIYCNPFEPADQLPFRASMGAGLRAHVGSPRYRGRPRSGGGQEGRPETDLIDGCNYADSVLIPVLAKHDRFIDQE